MVKIARQITVIVVLAAGLPEATPAQDLETRLTKRLDAAPLDRHHWGVAILDRAGRLLFGRDANHLFTPASNTKLVTAAAGIVLLGPDYRAKTSVYSAGRIRDGVLEGDLVLYGRGDPTWSNQCYQLDTLAAGSCDRDPLQRLRELAGALKRRGIHTVTGRLIGDGSYLEATWIHPSWEIEDLAWSYGAPVSGLGFDENRLVATVVAQRPGEAPEVRLEPDLEGFVVINRAVTGSATGKTGVDWERTNDGAGFILTGIIAASATRKSELAVSDPNRWAALAFRRALADSGIAILGGVVGTSDSNATRDVRTGPPLAETFSRPLRDWTFRILNVSQNWIAETTLKLIGRTLAGIGSWNAGLGVERRFLIDSVGIDSTQFKFYDGSGLSPKNLVAPIALAKLLVYMQHHPKFSAFAAGLPRSGSVGTLSERFGDSTMHGKVRAKTGSMTQVNALSGFLDKSAGDTVPCRVFSIMANQHILGSKAMMVAIDSLILDVWIDGCTEKTVPPSQKQSPDGGPDPILPTSDLKTGSPKGNSRTARKSATRSRGPKTGKLKRPASGASKSE